VLRWITAGESHGPALVAVLEGMVAGVGVTTKDVAAELARRRLGHGRGARMKFEADEVDLLGGVRHGVTLGGPVAIRIGNTEWPKWEIVMAADPVDPAMLAELARNAPLTRPRPGHADLAGMTKYGFDDARPVLERASARETASRVALGAVAKAFLRQALGVEVLSHVVSLGEVEAPAGVLPGPGDLERVDASPVRVFDRRRPRRWSRRWTPRSGTVTPSAGWSRSSRTDCPSASARSSPATAGSTPASPARSWVSRR